MEQGIRRIEASDQVEQLLLKGYLYKMGGNPDSATILTTCIPCTVIESRSVSKQSIRNGMNDLQAIGIAEQSKQGRSYVYTLPRGRVTRPDHPWQID